MTVKQNQVAELAFYSTASYADPFNEVTFDVQWTDPSGNSVTVPGFWDGKNCWKVRYSSAKLGVHRYTTVCNQPDAGLNGQQGQLEVQAYTGDNPLYLHGSICRKDKETFLRHQDGTPFFWLADTWWMGLTTRLAYPDDFETMVKDRVEKGFSVVQIVAGLYPDMLPFDPRGKNEGGFPWDEQFQAHQPCVF